MPATQGLLLLCCRNLWLYACKLWCFQLAPSERELDNPRCQSLTPA